MILRKFVRLKLTKAPTPNELAEVVSIYTKLSPKWSKLVAPALPVGEDVFVDSIKFFNFPLNFYSLHSRIHFVNKYPPWLGKLTIVAYVICILSSLVRF